MTPHLAGRLALERVESLLPAELRGVEGSTRFAAASGGARLSGGTQLVGARGPALPLFHAAAGAAAGVLRAHIAQGNPAAVLHGTGPDAEIVIHGEGEEMCVATLAEMPVTLGAAAACNVANVLAAAAMAHAHEVPLAAIQAGIRSFIPSLSTRPVCLNLVQAHGQTVVFDYAQRRIISHFSGCRDPGAREHRGACKYRCRIHHGALCPGRGMPCRPVNRFIAALVQATSASPDQTHPSSPGCDS